MVTRIHDRQIEHRGDLPRLTDDAKATIKTITENVDTELTPVFELRESTTPDLILNVGAGRIKNIDTGLSRTFSPIKSLFFDFTGGTVTFPAISGGAIVVAPGIDSVLTVGVGNYITVLTQIDSIGQLTVTIGLEAATIAESTNSINFPVAFKTSLPIGYVTLQNVGGTIQSVINDNITQFVGGGGSGGGGDDTADFQRYQNRLNLAPFSYANTNIAVIDEDDQLDPLSTISYDIPKAAFKFEENTSEVLVSTQQLDSDFLDENTDISTVELYAIWNLDSIDTAATYEVSRDGGTNYQTLSMNRIGNSDAYRGIINFIDEGSNAFSQEYALANADGTKDLNSSTVVEISQQFTVANAVVYKDIIAYVNKASVGSTGYLFAEIVKDNAGFPSTDVNDIMWSSAPQIIDDMVIGDNVVNIDASAVLKAGEYHLIFTTDLAYKTGYDANVNNKISLKANLSSGPTPNLITKDNLDVTTVQASETLTYRLEGRELDVRVRITSSNSAEDKFLSSYGLFYKFEDGIDFSTPVYREKFLFDGTTDNFNEFSLTEFLPDSRLLMCFALGTGQVFRYGDFVLDGVKVSFPPNTFNVVGQVELEFFQLNSVAGPSSTVADALLTANHLGSTDPSLDKSVNGRGILLRRPDGVFKEITIDNSNNIQVIGI